LSAPSIASVPELQKKTASRYGRRAFRQRLGQHPLKSEQSICTMFGRSARARHESPVSPPDGSGNVETL